MSLREASIGVFDSGLGGLSVLSALRARLPNESFDYVGDSAYCPYGEKDEHTIEARVHAMVGVLANRGCKLVVVACNTACSVAITSLRNNFELPIVGLEPAVKPAANRSRTGRVAVLATPRTASGAKLHTLIATYAGGVVVERISAPGLVELVESGEISGAAAREALWELLYEPINRGCDVIVLGCTHYPFLSATITSLFGRSIVIMDSGYAVARQTETLLERNDLARLDSSFQGECTYLTTGDAESFAAIATRLLGNGISASTVTTAERVPA